jgi:hypothetical protein
MASYSTTIKVSATPERITEAVKSAVARLGLKSVEWSPDMRWVTGKTERTWQSWGERVSIDIAGDGEITIKSKSVVITTLFDYDRNLENCGHVVEAILAVLSLPEGQEAAAVQLPAFAPRPKPSLARVVVAALIIGLVAGSFSVAARKLGTPSMKSRIGAICEAGNKGCPKTMDKYLRLDSWEVGPDNRMIQKYTLLSNPVPDDKMPGFFAGLKSQSERKCRSSAVLKKLLDQGAIMTYRYYDDEGTMLEQYDVKGGGASVDSTASAAAPRA